MNSGCICCSLTGDFRAALHEVCERYAPDRILIEPSGVGKLSDIVTAVEQASDGELTINALCTVVDAGKCKMYMRNFGEFFNNQVESAGCIILRTAGIKEERLAECVALLREKNPAPSSSRRRGTSSPARRSSTRWKSATRSPPRLKALSASTKRTRTSTSITIITTTSTKSTSTIIISMKRHLLLWLPSRR